VSLGAFLYNPARTLVTKAQADEIRAGVGSEDTETDDT
jgi:hypothetical protein